MFQLIRMPPTILFVALLCLFATAVAGVAPVRGQQEPDGPAATVVALRGGATAVNAAGEARRLSPGDTLEVTDTIHTGSTGRLQLMFTDNTIISLGVNAEMEVSDYQWDGEQGALSTRVNEGVFRVMGGAISRTSPENFTTETPSATIGIRGSMYAGRVSNGTLTVVFQGGTGIRVTNSAGTVEITTPGTGTRVSSRDEAPEEPAPFTEDDLAELEDEEVAEEEAAEEEAAADEEAVEEEGVAEEEAGEGDAAAEEAAEEDGAASAEEETPAAETAPVEDEAPLADEMGLEDDMAFDDPVVAETEPTEPVVFAAIEDATSEFSQGEITQEAEESAESTTVQVQGRGVMALHNDTNKDELYHRYGSASATRAADGATTVTVAGYQLPFTFNWSTSGSSYGSLPNMVEVAPGTPYSLTIGSKTFDNYHRHLYADDLGGFFYLKLSDDLEVQDLVHGSLIYAGVPSTATRMPTSGVDNYIGWLGGKSSPVSPSTDYDGFLEPADMEVNWANKKFIGVIRDEDHHQDDRRKAVFFFGDLSNDRTTMSRTTVIGRDAYWGDDDLKSSAIYGTSLAGGFYGEEYQGFGAYGSGSSYNVYNTLKTENWDIVTGMFRDPDDHSVSPTGSISTQGFVVGVAKGFNFAEGPTAVAPLVFRNSDPEGLQVVLDQDTGRVYGTVSAADETGWSIDSIYVGSATDDACSAYVLSDNFIALLNSDTADPSSRVNYDGIYGDLKPNQNFMVTAEPTDTYSAAPDHHQFSQHVTWGYWAVAFEDPSNGDIHYDINTEHAYWIAGELTPGDYFTSGFTGEYSGPAYGSRISGTDANALTGGETELLVDFGTNSIGGTITFSGYLDNNNNSVEEPAVISFSGTSGASFNITTATVAVGGDAPGGAGAVSGAFFGDQAQAVAGSFDVENTNRYVGIFGGNLP